MNNKSIGFFDSGIGGITIWQSIINLLPNENTIYLADSINSPYGTKTKEELTKICEKNIEFLINKGCKIKKPLEKEAFFKDIRKIRIFK